MGRNTQFSDEEINKAKAFVVLGRKATKILKAHFIPLINAWSVEKLPLVWHEKTVATPTPRLHKTLRGAV